MAEADGQAGNGTQTTVTGTETTQAAPGSQTTSAQTTPTGTGQAETFFDPESIKGKPELEAAYKDMQRAWTQKTTALKASEQKISAYDSFIANPVRALQELAPQYGFNLTKAEAKAIVEGQKQNQFEPQSWDDVIGKAKEEALQDILKQLQPFLKEVNKTRQTQLEKVLDDSCPDWRVYEDKMTKLVIQHPTLSDDPVTLYRLSLPPEVLESRATQAAIRKLQDKASSAQLSSGSSTTAQATTTRKAKSFNEAVQIAKEQLAAQGIRH